MGNINFAKFLDWVSTKKCFDDCGQGGECDFCNGYCCSNTQGFGESNGNCPAIALSSLLNEKLNEIDFYCLTEGVPVPPTEVPVPPRSCAEIKVWRLKIYQLHYNIIDYKFDTFSIKKFTKSCFTVKSTFKSAIGRF